MRKRFCSILVLLSALACARAAQFDVESLAKDPKVKAALKYLEDSNSTLIEDIIALTEIPAPPFKEQKRAEEMRRRFSSLNLQNVRIDEEGNVIGERKGVSGKPTLVVSAHLDTVFPEGTEVKVRRQGNRLYAPGIGDDTRGLAVLLALIRALNHAGIQTVGDLVFVCTVGEEGLGDLRGVKHLFLKGDLKGRIDMFISIDGADDARIVHKGIGSKRYRVTYNGPGGHSWGSFGLVNPASALGRAIAKLSSLKVPRRPKTTYNVGRIGGGTSVNAIPSEAWMEVDMRSESRSDLEELEKKFLSCVKEALDEENRFRGEGGAKLTVDIKLVGERPLGQIPVTSPIVQTAIAVTRHMGIEPRLGSGSTDSNLPISLGVQAITIGSGGKAGGAHSPGEWIDVSDGSIRGVKRALLIALSLVGAQ